MFSPLEEICLENDIVLLETVELMKKGRKFVDIFVYNPSPAEIVLDKGKIMGRVSDVAAAFSLPIPENKKNVDINEVNVEQGDHAEIKFDLDHLSEEEREMASEMLKEEVDVFSKSKNDIGHIKDFKLKINLHDDIPVSEAYRKIPKHLYAEVKNHVNNLLANGWIQESYSPSSSANTFGA